MLENEKDEVGFSINLKRCPLEIECYFLFTIIKSQIWQSKRYLQLDEE